MFRNVDERTFTAHTDIYLFFNDQLLLLLGTITRRWENRCLLQIKVTCYFIPSLMKIIVHCINILDIIAKSQAFFHKIIIILLE